MHISRHQVQKTELVKLSDMVHNQGSSHKVNFLDCCLCSEVTRQRFCHHAVESARFRSPKAQLSAWKASQPRFCTNSLQLQYESKVLITAALSLLFLAITYVSCRFSP